MPVAVRESSVRPPQRCSSLVVRALPRNELIVVTANTRKTPNVNCVTRTSRSLKYASVYNVDFIWLTDGLVPDHSTLAEFFSRFRPELNLLFKQVSKIAMRMCSIRLGGGTFRNARRAAQVEFQMDPPVTLHVTSSTSSASPVAAVRSRRTKSSRPSRSASAVRADGRPNRASDACGVPSCRQR